MTIFGYTYMNLKHCHNINDLRRLAKKKLPAPMFHYMDGGADDEYTLKRNSTAFDDYELMPNYLVDISNIDLSSTLLGQKVKWPVMLSPTGGSGLFHHQAETAVANAASKAGSYYALSTMATTKLEDIAKLNDSPKMFQIYILKDRELTREFVQRCKNSGYESLCLTVDTPLAGNRERDLVTGMTIPPRFTFSSIISFAAHWQWTFNALKHPKFTLANIAHRVDALSKSGMSIPEYVNSQFDRTVTWEDAAWLVKEWGGPFVIKGIHSVHDAIKAKEIGATGIMISNHGGRQLDGVPAAIDCLKEIREAVGNDMELIVDGGVRRASHIIKALAMGANAVSIGRPYLYGLAAGGEKGVDHALNLLKKELERDMALLGCKSIADLDESYIRSLKNKNM